MNGFGKLTTNLRRALEIVEQIEKLEAELSQVIGATHGISAAAPAALPARKGKRKLSAEARERIAAAQRARWAKAKGKQASKGAKPRGKLSDAGRAKIVAAMKARWAAKKAIHKSA